MPHPDYAEVAGALGMGYLVHSNKTQWAITKIKSVLFSEFLVLYIYELASGMYV
jgi:hypothetical protein